MLDKGGAVVGLHTLRLRRLEIAAPEVPSEIQTNAFTCASAAEAEPGGL